MKTKVILMAALILLLSLPVISQPASFNGEWKINREKTSLEGNQLFLSKITVQIKNDSLLTIRTYETGIGEEYPFAENLSLDGKECKIIIYDMPRTSKAKTMAGDGTIAMESVTTFYGSNGEQNLVTKELWKITDGGKTLNIEFSTSMADNSTSGIHYFDRVK